MLPLKFAQSLSIESNGVSSGNTGELLLCTPRRKGFVSVIAENVHDTEIHSNGLPKSSVKQNLDACSTLDDIVEMFETKTSLLKEATKLRSIDAPTLSKTFGELDQTVAQLHHVVVEVRQEVQKRKRNLEILESLSERLDLLNSCLDRELEKMPAKDSKDNGEAMNKACTPRPMIEPDVPLSKEQSTQNQSKKFKVPPKMNSLTAQEFQSVPKYLKGRLTAENINHFIDAFNKTIDLKYQLLTTPRSNLGTAQFKTVQEFKKQESKETNGTFFCVQGDLKTYGQVKVDNNLKNILAILRHCSRMREIRGPGPIVRYSVVTN